MDWITVISFILLGIVLIIAEIILIPGTTVVGFLGFGLAVVGIVLSFNYFGETIGWITLAGSGISAGAIFFWSLRAKPWEMFSLNTAIKSRVNEGALLGLHAGEEGITVSSLRPQGKAEIAGKMYEVSTLGHFVDTGTKIKVVKLTSNQIFVEPLN